MLQLEKYKSKNSRFTCPVCGGKNSFARYIDENGNYLSDDVGRCNRESTCGYHKKPKDFFAENPDHFNSNSFDKPQKKYRTQQYFSYKNTSDSQQTEKNIVSNIDEKYLIASLKNSNAEENNFIWFLETLFTLETVQNLSDRFGIGTAKDRKTIFWQIDEKGFIRTGRVMLYDKETGKRSKEIHQNWIHSILQNKGLIKDFALNQCLFGLHQILNGADQHKIIGIVESDKTAILATAAIPDIVWMSAGAKSYLNADRLKPLANRKVILFPDSDAFETWSEKAKELRSIVPSLKVSKYLDDLLTLEQKKQGLDIADFLIQQRQMEVFNRQLFNLKVDQIHEDENLRERFEELYSERMAIMTESGLPETEASEIFFQPKNIESLILENF